MATQSKKTEKEIENKKVDIANQDFKDENEKLKKQIEEMETKMNLLIQQVSMGMVSNTNQNRQEKNIQFISLVPGILVLKGTQIWKIEGQFNSRSFIEREARMIVNNSKNIIQSGFVYIADADFVKENDLDYIYDNLLNDEQLKNLLERSFKEVVEIYKSVPKTQKEIIVRMIKDKKEAGVEIDANILKQISQICGQDLISETKYEDEE